MRHAVQSNPPIIRPCFSIRFRRSDCDAMLNQFDIAPLQRRDPRSLLDPSFVMILPGMVGGSLGNALLRGVALYSLSWLYFTFEPFTWLSKVRYRRRRVERL